MWSASPSLRIYAGSSLYSRIKRRGKKVKISSFNVYSVPWGNEKVRRGIALIKLEQPLVRKDGVVPICLAPRDELPPLHASCYVSHYDRSKHLVEEELVMVARKPRCLDADHKKKHTFRGICTMDEKRPNYLQLGAPITCIINGRAFQYGVYLNHISLEINSRANQMLGYYSELDIIHDVLFGKKVSTEPVKQERPHPAGVPVLPVQKPAKAFIDPAIVPVTIFNSNEQVSLSLSSSFESQKTETQANTYDSAGHVKPSSYVEPIQHVTVPAPVRTSGKSGSSSHASSEQTTGSLSTSSSFSAETNTRSADNEIHSASAEESFQSSETAKVLRVKVQSVKSPTVWGIEQPVKKPVLLPAVSSEETKERRPYIGNEIFPVPPSSASVGPITESSGMPNDINPFPMTVAPVTLKTKSKSSSSSSSASSGSKSGSVEHIAFPATKEETTTLHLPSSSEQTKPCSLPQPGPFPNTPSAPVVCASANNAKEQFDNTVFSPFPIPEYPSRSVESNHLPLIPPRLMRYDLSSKSVTDHEHVMVHTFTGTPSGPCGATVSEEAGFNRLSHAPNDNFNGSSSLSHIQGSHGAHVSGSMSSMSHISDGVQSSSFYGPSGAISTGVTSSGHVHGSSNVKYGGDSYSNHIEETNGVLNTGSVSSGHFHKNHYDEITSSNNVHGLSGVRSTEMSFSSNENNIMAGSVSSGHFHKNHYNEITSSNNVHGLSGVRSTEMSFSSNENNIMAVNEIYHGTSGMHSRETMSSGQSSRTSGTQIISSRSSENLQGSSGRHSGNFSPSNSALHGSHGAQSGGIATSGCKYNSVGNDFSSSSGGLPGASGVHIFDVSDTSAEEACTGTLYVESGKTYSDHVITAARCVWSKMSGKYAVYVGSLLPRQMTTDHIDKTLIHVERINTVPFYAEHADLKAMGMAVLKLRHKVKAIQGVQSFSLPHVSTGAYPSMQCFVSGVCEHGMPVRVQYQLLTPRECRSRLGQTFFPSLMYCGIGKKGILQYNDRLGIRCNLTAVMCFSLLARLWFVTFTESGHSLEFMITHPGLPKSTTLDTKKQTVLTKLLSS
ncbi:Trypsin domain containing protein [Trichuris trichiura]|uniref:Trypsin domain containing protein n=1 Tax=Trichuris trichiura TaxID=36087 RepID=A0A077ZI67_TRITR|nr:Trypsin domain containing protein [Trichuris trichiura]